MLQPDREDRLLDLAGDRALLGQEQVLGELLGDGRAALHPPPFHHIAQHRAADAQGIDAPMGIEAMILDGDEGLGQIGGQIPDMDRGAAGVAAIGEQGAVIGENGDVGRTLGHGELVDGRQLPGMPGDKRAQTDDAPHPQHRAVIDQHAQHRAAALGCGLALGLALARRGGLLPVCLLLGSLVLHGRFCARALARHRLGFAALRLWAAGVFEKGFDALRAPALAQMVGAILRIDAHLVVARLARRRQFGLALFAEPALAAHGARYTPQLAACPAPGPQFMRP